MRNVFLNSMKIDKMVITYFVILIFLQFFPGIDLTHHLEAARLYNEMITNKVLYLKNPYLLAGEQLTIVYGPIFYLLAGIAWFFFKRFTIDILILVSVLLSFVLIINLTDKLRYRLIALILLSGLSVPDAYVGCLVNLLLWLTAYLFIKGKRYYQIPLIIGCLAHPFAIIVGLYYAYKDKRNRAVIIIATLYFIIIGAIFTLQGNAILSNFVPTMIARVFGGLYPLLLYERLREKVVAWLSSVVAIGIILSNILQFVIVEPGQIRGFYEDYQSLFEDFPSIKGNMRVVDYNYLPSAYYFHQKGLTINTGSFFESWIYNTRRNWKSVNEYESYLKDNDISYILLYKKSFKLPKMLEPITVLLHYFLVDHGGVNHRGSVFPGASQMEEDILSERHKLIWENGYYKLYLRDG